MFRLILWANVFLLVGHIFMERARGDLNALRIGERSTISATYIRLEGVFTLILILLLFDRFYPDMKKLFTAKESLLVVCVITIQLLVWFLYK
jgi:hypothetical protein